MEAATPQPVDAPIDAVSTPQSGKSDVVGQVMDALKAAIASPAFWPAVVVAIGLTLCFLPLWPRLKDLWGSADGYYSHGPIVPLISAFVIFKWWPRIKTTPVKPGLLAIPFLLATLFLMYPANASRIEGLMSLGLLTTMLLGTWAVAGWRWMLNLAGPILYLGFALPLWTAIINNTTNPLQIISTNVAFQLLKLCGFLVYQSDPTVIYMNSFVLNVEVACSGLKLLLALTAFTIFFVMIARLKLWANIMAIAMIPFFALLVNGLRIALIGVVGETWGSEAGLKFHDYSGYITLVLCFFVLFKVFRWLGWKD